MEKVLLQYGVVAELIEDMGDGSYKVKITGKNEVTEKIVNYRPLPVDGWKYEDKTMFQKIDTGKYHRIMRYTTYVNKGIQVYAYKMLSIDTFGDRMVYEDEVSEKYVIENGPFIGYTAIRELMEKLDEDIKPLREEIKEAEDKIKDTKAKIKDVELSYNIGGLCAHEWDEIDQEIINDGKTTVKIYECQTCGKEDKHYWHKLI